MIEPKQSTTKPWDALRHRGWPPALHIKIVRSIMMTSSNENIFRVTGHLCGEFTGHRWIPRTMASVAELWFFLWSVPDLRRHRVHYDVVAMFWRRLRSLLESEPGSEIVYSTNVEGIHLLIWSHTSIIMMFASICIFKHPSIYKQAGCSYQGRFLYVPVNMHYHGKHR